MTAKKNTETKLRGKVIIVTGGGGFLGTHLVGQLKKEHPKRIIVPHQ
jgi:FlaA1/EpsC-like NDP-sugar epimerase